MGGVEDGAGVGVLLLVFTRRRVVSAPLASGVVVGVHLSILLIDGLFVYSFRDCGWRIVSKKKKKVN